VAKTSKTELIIGVKPSDNTSSVPRLGGDAHQFNQQIASIELKQMNGLQGIAHAKILGFQWRLVFWNAG
jgi:hypothetical protein